MRRGLLRGLVGMVYGGLPDPRPDQGAPSTSAGVAPGTASGTFRGRLVVVFGSGPSSGVFVYNGPPASLSSSLIASIAATAGNDPQGRPYQAGIVTYAGTSFLQLLAGVISFLTAGDTAAGTINGGAGGVSVQSGTSAATFAQATLQVLESLTDIAHGPRVTLGSNSSVAALLGWAQGSANPVAPDRPSLTWPPGVPHLVEIDNDDGNAYSLQHLYSESSTDEPISLTTFSFVCGGSVPVSGTAGQPGRYRIRATLTCQQGPNAVADNYRIGFTGTISQVRARARFVSTTAGGQPVFTAFTTSNNGLLASQAVGANVVYFVDIDAFITVTSNGQIGIQAAMSGAGDTFTVLALSTFELFRA